MTDIKRTIVGRSNAPTIQIQGYAFGLRAPDVEVDITLEGAEIRLLRSSKFDVRALHEDGTDFEHSSSSVAWFDGVGIDMTAMHGGHITFEGVILGARYYDEDQSFEVGTEFPHSHDDPVVRMCDLEDCQKPPHGPHRLMPYLPPDVTPWVPIEARISVSYYRLMKED